MRYILSLGTVCTAGSGQRRCFKGNPGEPIVEETTFGWVVHGGDEYTSDSACMYLKEVNDYEKLYSLDVLGVEDQGGECPT